MSKGTLNSVTLIGRMGADIETRFNAGGAMFGNFNLATNRSYKDKNGEWQQETDWHRVTRWGRIAEFLKNYSRKGSLLHVGGRLQTRSWDDKGQKRFITEVVAQECQILAGWKDGQAYPPAQDGPAPEMPSGDETKTDSVPF